MNQPSTIWPTIRPEIEDEAQIIILSSGEMPEVAFYDSLNQLEKENVTLEPAELRRLEEAVLLRYQHNIERDLTPEKAVESSFRGPLRAAVNWRRLIGYARARAFDLTAYRDRNAALLADYIRVEADAVAAGRPYHTLGMTREEASDFCRALGLNGEVLQSRMDRLDTVPVYDFKKAIVAARRAQKQENR